MKKLTIGISILAVFALAFTFSSGAVAKEEHHMPSDDITVSNFNGAVVLNLTGSAANTGGNLALANAQGGMIGINAGLAGGIMTGKATSTALTMNYVNDNWTRIDNECCGQRGDIRVRNANLALVGNATLSVANTGLNGAVANAQNGMGCANLAGAGLIKTGNAESWAETANVVNSNTTRIVKTRPEMPCGGDECFAD